MHITLPGAGRILHLCEVQVYNKRAPIWRQLSGIAEVAAGKATSQSTTATVYTSDKAVDGRTTNNFATAPATCTQTAINTNNAAQATQFNLDLGAVYDVKVSRSLASTLQ